VRSFPDAVNAIHFHRLQHWLLKRGVPILPRVIHRLIFLLFNSAIPPAAELGEGTWFGYGGMGVVIHKDARLGRRVFVSPQVTVGGRSGHREVPVIEDDVYIGSGAKVLGPIRIGRGATIGANAVVLADVPAGAVVAGVPARVIRIGGPPPERPFGG
jgi:serine O-acetyltransferase